MFLFWRCSACGLRRHASVSEIAYDQKGRLKSWPCQCKEGYMKMFKSKDMPDIPTDGYQGKDPLADIPEGDATAPPAKMPLVIPQAGPEEVPSDPVRAALAAGDGQAPQLKIPGPGPKPVEGDAADAEIEKAWNEASGAK